MVCLCFAMLSRGNHGLVKRLINGLLVHVHCIFNAVRYNLYSD